MRVCFSIKPLSAQPDSGTKVIAAWDQNYISASLLLHKIPSILDNPQVQFWSLNSVLPSRNYMWVLTQLMESYVLIKVMELGPGSDKGIVSVMKLYVFPDTGNGIVCVSWLR